MREDLTPVSPPKDEQPQRGGREAGAGLGGAESQAASPLWPRGPVVALAPMAGVTDKPFRILCLSFGADWAVGEMLSDNPELARARKTSDRADRFGEPGTIVTQIAGADPKTMGEAARRYAAEGSAVIDVNMGCPAKKVARANAGSALMADEDLAARIMEAVAEGARREGAVATLKTRLGVSADRPNALAIARRALGAGFAGLAVHARYKDQLFAGVPDFESVARLRAALGDDLPLLANGDVRSPEQAARVLASTGARGVMVGRGSFGRPWIFRQIKECISLGTWTPMGMEEGARAVLGHLEALYSFYGPGRAVRIARKHIGRYLSPFPEGRAALGDIFAETGELGQYRLVERFFAGQSANFSLWPGEAEAACACGSEIETVAGGVAQTEGSARLGAEGEAHRALRPFPLPRPPAVGATATSRGIG